MIINMIENILGPAPLEFEWLTYVIGTVILMYLIQAILALFSLFGLPKYFK